MTVYTTDELHISWNYKMYLSKLYIVSYSFPECAVTV